MKEELNFEQFLCNQNSIKNNSLINFRHVRKTTKSYNYIRLVCPSAWTTGCNWMDIHDIWYSVICRKSVKKIHVSLKSENVRGILHEDE